MTVTQRQIQCHGMFAMKGYPLSGACAIVGNLVRESGPELPSKFRSGKLDHGSQGLAQWRLARLTNFLAFARRAAAEGKLSFEAARDSMSVQVGFIDEELRTDYPALRAKLMKGGDVAALTADFCWQFERPSKALSGIDLRIAAAKALAVEVGAKPDTVVDHLQVAVKKQTTAQQGGTVIAATGLVAATAAGLSQTVSSMPTWELVLIGGGVLAAAVGLVGAVAAGHKASDLRTAIAGVTPDAPPEAQVEHTVVEAPAEPAPVQLAAPLTADDVASIVQAEIAKALVQVRPDLNQPPAWTREAKAEAIPMPAILQTDLPGLAGSNASLRDRLAAGATMGIGRSTPELEPKESKS